MSCMDQSEALLRTGARHLGACGIVRFGFCVWDPSCVILCLDCCVWDLSCGIFRLGFCVWDLSYMIDSLGLCVWDLSCGIFSFCVWYRSCVSLCFGFPMWDRSRGIVSFAGYASRRYVRVRKILCLWRPWFHSTSCLFFKESSCDLSWVHIFM